VNASTLEVKLIVLKYFHSRSYRTAFDAFEISAGPHSLALQSGGPFRDRDGNYLDVVFGALELAAVADLGGIKLELAVHR